VFLLLNKIIIIIIWNFFFHLQNRWNGNDLVIEDCNGNLIGEVTMESGSSTFRKLCLKDKNFTVTMNGGTYQVTTHYDADQFCLPSLFTRCTIHHPVICMYTMLFDDITHLLIFFKWYIKGRSILDFERCQRTGNH
jgi:hypothetical protein